MEDFTVVLPVLNELDNLVILLPELEKLGCEIIVCDNGSTDSGPEYVKYYHRDVILSKGWGTVVNAIQRGLTLASHDKVLVMDSDLSHPVATVPLLIRVLGVGNTEVVVGTRLKSGDSLRNRLISWGFNTLSYFLVPRIKDRSSGFWAARLSLIRDVKIRNTTKPMLEYIVRGKISKIGEVGYEFKPRQSGQSKIGKPILKEFYSLALLYISKFQRPIKFCMVGGSGALLQLSLLALFTEVFGLFYILSSVASIGIVTWWTYLWNNYWTFKQESVM